MWKELYCLGAMGALYLMNVALLWLEKRMVREKDPWQAWKDPWQAWKGCVLVEVVYGSD
jgi:hypothetical protein